MKPNQGDQYIIGAVAKNSVTANATIIPITPAIRYKTNANASLMKYQISLICSLP